MDDLTAMLADWRNRNRTWPPAFPPGPRDAAHFWITRQEPARDNEKPHQVPVASTRQGQDTQRWVTPYNLRLTQSLQSFLTHKPDQQRYILAAIEDGHVYRGEDNRTPHDCFDGRTLFQNIVHETERMQELGRDAYIAEIRSRATTTVAGKMTS
jgi:hypothetical protein